jgi:hypothetical protein
MAYSAAKHSIFSSRMKNWFDSFQNLRDELARMDAIYVNETSSGADSDFVDNSTATKQEHIDGIVFMRALVDFTEGNAVSTLDREANITAFTQ